MKDIGNKLINPHNEEISRYQYIRHNGLTYREWLIGMIASATPNVGLYGVWAQDCIKQADEIIEQLDNEN